MKKDIFIIAVALLAVIMVTPFLMGAAVQLDKPYTNLKSGTVTLAAAANANPFGTISGNPMQALIQADGGEVRYWLDGTTPTSNSGFALQDGATTELISPEQIAGLNVYGGAGVKLTYNIEGKQSR